MQNRILTILFLFATILSALAEEERSYSELEEVEVYGEQQHQLSDFSEAAHYQADTLLINNSGTPHWRISSPNTPPMW